MRSYNGFPFQLAEVGVGELEKFYLEEAEESQEAEEREQPGEGFLTNHVMFVEPNLKQKPTPVRMYRDQENLFHENMRLRKQYSLLMEKRDKLRSESKMYQQHHREIKDAISRISSILPKKSIATAVKQPFGEENKLAKESEKVVIEQLASLRRSVAATRLYESQIYKEALQHHRLRLAKEHDILTKKNNSLFRESDLTSAQSEAYRNHQQRLLHQRESRRLTHQLVRSQSYKQQRLALDGLNKKKRSSMQLRIKELHRKLAEAQFLSEGLEYELTTVSKYKSELPVLEKELHRAVEAITQRQEKIQLLKRTLEDKSTTHQYMKKWTDELKQRLDEKKRLEAQAKQKLESKINQLNKEFEEWNSRYKTLLIQDQAQRHIRRAKEAPQVHTTKKNKTRLVKRYEIERICKKIQFMLTLQDKSIEAFADTIIRRDRKLSQEAILERLKEVDFLCEEPNLARLARFVMEDSDKPDQISEVDYNLMRTILINTVGRPLSYQAYLSNLENLTKAMPRLHDELRHQISGLNRVEHFDEDRLLQAFQFLEPKVTSQQVRSLCIRLFDYGDELDSYSLLTLRRVFARPTIVVEEVE